MGWKAEVKTIGDGDTYSRNGEVWPDSHSADLAGANLAGRWTRVLDWRVVEVDDEPNRPTWHEWIKQNGLPARSVQL